MHPIIYIFGFLMIAKMMWLVWGVFHYGLLEDDGEDYSGWGRP